MFPINDGDRDPELLHPKAMPSFAYVRAFEAVGRLGGVRAAAAALALDHTVVSRHLRALEDWLGTPLFHRASGRLTLTDAGGSYHARVSSALVELASATRQIMEGDDHRFLRVWCVPGFAAQWLSHQLALFDRATPHVQVELRPTDRAADLLIHEADVDIRFHGDKWPPGPGGRGLRSTEIARPPIMMVASPEVATRFATMRHVSDLLDGPLLHEEHHHQWRTWLELNGVSVPERLPGPLLWHAHMAIAAAKQGRGIALASTYLVARDLADGTLRQLRLPGATSVVIGGYFFTTREDRWNAPPIARLRQFLQAAVQPQRG